MFKTSRRAAPRDLFLFGHHAACQRGAMFKTSRRAAQCVQHLEHRCTLASSVVAKHCMLGHVLESYYGYLHNRK